MVIDDHRDITSEQTLEVVGAEGVWMGTGFAEDHEVDDVDYPDSDFLLLQQTSSGLGAPDPLSE